MLREICCQVYIFIFYRVQSILNVLPLLSGDQTDTQNSRSALRSPRSISVMEVNGKFSSASKSDLTETSEPILIRQHHSVIKYQPERRKGTKTFTTFSSFSYFGLKNMAAGELGWMSGTREPIVATISLPVVCYIISRDTTCVDFAVACSSGSFSNSQFTGSLNSSLTCLRHVFLFVSLK